ncbi:MAG: helix-turn-helix domain-containing protein [Deltaproteobacteria bacterium]|nr:helix-turn-helix domain-containing protein [Deltaproteobacteria bacterium]
MKREMEIPHLLTPENVARIFQVRTVTIYQWARRGILPCLKIEKCVRFDPEDIREFLERRRRGN